MLRVINMINKWPEGSLNYVDDISVRRPTYNVHAFCGLIISIQCLLKLHNDVARTNPTLGVSSNMGWGVSDQCWVYQIFCGVILNSRTSPIAHFICSLFEQTPHGHILKKIYI